MIAAARQRIEAVFAEERDRYALWAPVWIGSGVGLYFAWTAEPVVWHATLVLLFALAGGVLVRKYAVPRMAMVALVLMALGFVAAAWRTQAVEAPALTEELHFRDVEGRIDDIQTKPKGEQLILTDVTIEGVPAEQTPKRISISLRQTAPELHVGDRIGARAMLFPPPAPAMTGAYDFARSFYYQQIGAVGYAPSSPELLEHEEASGFTQWLNKLRLSLNDRIIAPMSPENGPVAAAMMVGEQSAVSKDVNDAMRNAGLYHVLSISGLHMSLAVGLVYFTVRLLLSLWPTMAMRIPAKKIAATIGLISAFAYLLVAGYPVPAIRSFVMVACVMVAILFDRSGISVFSLAWSAVVILLWHPESLLGASFQLSYAATLSILAFYERYGDVLHKPSGGIVHKVWLYFLAIMLTSLVATLATTPLVIYQFNRFTLWGIAANMLMIPLASFWIMPAAVVAFLMLPFGLEHYPLVVLDRGIGWMIAGSRWFGSLPYASIAVKPPHFIGILIAVYGGLWLCLWQGRWRLLGIPAVILGMATVIFYQPYDLLVNDEGNKIAWRYDGEHFAFIRGRPTSYDAQIWLRYHGQEEGITVTHMDEAQKPECNKQRCLIEAHNYRITAARRGHALGLCDDKADIIIAADAVDCPNVKLIIDQHYLEAHGAVGLRFVGDNLEVKTVAETRGNRPWNTEAKSVLVAGDNPAITDRNEDEKP